MGSLLLVFQMIVQYQAGQGCGDGDGPGCYLGGGPSPCTAGEEGLPGKVGDPCYLNS